eukprot:5045110-Amphidinium_carterae.1
MHKTHKMTRKNGENEQNHQNYEEKLEKMHKTNKITVHEIDTCCMLPNTFCVLATLLSVPSLWLQGTESLPHPIMFAFASPFFAHPPPVLAS